MISRISILKRERAETKPGIRNPRIRKTRNGRLEKARVHRVMKW